jgi:hypothetical protein
MPFSEEIRIRVKKQADFTCCWCNNRDNKVDVHHIVPQANGGPDTEDNAAPLCGSCHDKFGNNPDLRKEIKSRRDHWYEICQKRLEFVWSPNLHVPLLDSHEINIPTDEKTSLDTTLHDWPRFRFLSGNNNNGVSPVQVSMGYYPELRGGNKYPKFLSIRVEVPFGLSFNLEVCAMNYWDTSELTNTINNKKDIWLIKCHPDENSQIDPIYQLRDYLMLVKMADGENRLLMKTYLSTGAGITFRAKLTDNVLMAFSAYLEEKGFFQM